MQSLLDNNQSKPQQNLAEEEIAQIIATLYAKTQHTKEKQKDVVDNWRLQKWK